MKTYIKIIVTTAFSFATLFANAQSGADYKHPFSKNVERTSFANFINTSTQSNSNNYKHPVYSVRVARTKIEIPECCNKVRVSDFYSAANYKHPLTKFAFKSCGLGYVCNDKVQLACCL